MKRSTIGRVVGVFVLAVAAGLSAKLESRRDVAQMADSARSFLASLSDEQRTRGAYAFEDSQERMNFHFVPGEVFERHGVSLKEMNSEQKSRTHALLAAGLSQSGHMTAMEIMEVEGILQAMEGGSTRFSRDPELYLMSVFGTPSTDATWGWRFEGHHLSLHFTIVDGSATVSTPTFLGASPAVVMEGPRRGLRPLAAQEAAARALRARWSTAAPTAFPTTSNTSRSRCCATASFPNPTTAPTRGRLPTPRRSSWRSSTKWKFRFKIPENLSSG